MLDPTYRGVQTNLPTDPPTNLADPIRELADSMPVMGRRRVIAPRTQDQLVGWRVWSWKTDPTVLSPEKVVVFRRWERFASGFSLISLEMAWYLWDPARSHRNSARS